MSQNNLSANEQLKYAVIGILIGIAYVGLFMGITNHLENTNWQKVSIIPVANAQIEPFEIQIENIRDPKECTRKVVQGRSAEIPFILKVFYDTTKDSEFKIKQQGTSFPLTQRTNQVMTFYTNSTDQYEIYLEMNYRVARDRQVYIEYLSGNQIVQSEQEKFSTNKFCMTIFANTVLPQKIPTKQELFGDVYYFLDQIPAMVEGFNRNTITTASAIAYIWLLLFGVLLMSVITMIASFAGSRGYRQKIKDMDDYIEMFGELPETIDKIGKEFKKTMDPIIAKMQLIAETPTIKKELEKSSKSKFSSITKKLQKEEESKEVKKQKKSVFSLFQKKHNKDIENVQLCEKCDVGKHCNGEFDYCECSCCYEEVPIKESNEESKPISIIVPEHMEEPEEDNLDDLIIKDEDDLDAILRQTLDQKQSKKENPESFGDALEDELEQLAEQKPETEIKPEEQEEEQPEYPPEEEPEIIPDVIPEEKKPLEPEPHHKEDEEEFKEISLTDEEETEKPQPQAGLLKKPEPEHERTVDFSQYQDLNNLPELGREIMRQVNIVEKTADFTKYNYEELSAVFGWIQRYAEMLKTRKKQELPQRESVILNVIYDRLLELVKLREKDESK